MISAIILIASALAWRAVRAQIESEATARLQSHASRGAAGVEAERRSLVAMVAALGQSLRQPRRDTASLQAALSAVPLPLAGVSGIAVYDAHGRFVAASPQAALPRIGNLSARPELRHVINTRQPVLAQPTEAPESPATLILAAPVLGEEGVIESIVAVTLDPASASLFGPIRQGTAPDGVHSFVVTARHDLVFHPDPGRSPIRSKSEMQLAMGQDALSAWEGVREIAIGPIGPALASVRPVEGTDWYVVAMLPVEEAHAPLGASAARLVVIALAAWLASLATVFWASRSLNRPLVALRGRIERQKQHPDAPLEMDSLPPGEPERLAVAVGELVATYRQRERSLIAASEAQDILSTTLDRAEDAIIQFDAEGRITRWNRGAEQLFGWSAHETLGSNARNLHWAGATHEEFAAFENSMRRGEAFHQDGPRMTRSGQTVYVASTISPMFDREGRYVGALGTVRDITPLKRAEEALRRSEEKFFKAFHANPDFIMISRMHDGLIAEVNEGFERLTGYRAGEAIGRNVAELRLWVDPGDRREMVARLRAAGWVRNYESRFRTKSGEIRFVLASVTQMELGGEPHIIGTARDITELKRAQQQLRSSEEKFSAAFHANPDYFTITRLSDGVFLEANEAFESLTGYGAQEVVGRSIMEVGVLACEHEGRAFARKVADEALVRDWEVRLRTRSGGIRTVSATGVRIDIDNEPCMIVIARDVTTLKKAEEDIRRLNEELEQRVRLRTAELEQANRELESFSYSVSHDLRAPLRAIAGYSRILIDECAAELSDDARGMLERIDRNAIRLGELIDDLLNFARIGRTAINSSRVGMRELAAEVKEELLSAEANRAVRIRIGRLPAARGEPSLLRQVWINLIANALKFTRSRNRATIEIGGEASGNELHYWIRDNGTGFDPQYAGKLFNVFQRLHRDPAFEGTGVGLAIVSRIVQRHGGRVWAEGMPGEGAVFHFTLPVSVED